MVQVKAHRDRKAAAWLPAGATDTSPLQETGTAPAADVFLDVKSCGTPTRILEKPEERRRALGVFNRTIWFSYGGVTGEGTERASA